MSEAIGQVWREAVGCRNWPVMRVPLFISLRRNGMETELAQKAFSGIVDAVQFP